MEYGHLNDVGGTGEIEVLRRFHSHIDKESTLLVSPPYLS